MLMLNNIIVRKYFIRVEKQNKPPEIPKSINMDILFTLLKREISVATKPPKSLLLRTSECHLSNAYNADLADWSSFFELEKNEKNLTV